MNAVLDTLLPGDGDYPPFSALDQAAVAAPFADLFARLPADFATLAPAARHEALRELEAREPDGFGRLVEAAYLAYYTHARVREVIERLTDYPARPPQPLGYALDPFDDALLARQRARPQFWRKAP